MIPGPGSAFSIRQRKSWDRSSSVGALNEVIRTPCGSTSPTACRITPPLPEVSMPWSTSSTLRVPPVFPSANSRSWRSASPSPIAYSAALPFFLEPLKPGLPCGSYAARSTGPRGRVRVSVKEGCAMEETYRSTSRPPSRARATSRLTARKYFFR
jgi:hypothetical protein